MIVYLCDRGKFPDLQKSKLAFVMDSNRPWKWFWIVWLKVKLLHFNLFEDSLQKLCEVYENCVKFMKTLWSLWKLFQVHEKCLKFMQVFEVHDNCLKFTKPVWSLQNCLKFAKKVFWSLQKLFDIYENYLKFAKTV